MVELSVVEQGENIHSHVHSASGDLVTVPEAARRAGVSNAAVYKALHQGRLTGQRLAGGELRISEGALTAWLERRAAPARAGRQGGGRIPAGAAEPAAGRPQAPPAPVDALAALESLIRAQRELLDALDSALALARQDRT